MEDEARDVMTRLAERTGPPIRFTADDVVGMGRRQIRNRRIIGGVTGTALGVIAVGVGLSAGISPGASRAVEPGGATKTTPVTVPTTDPQCATELAKLRKAGTVLGPSETKLDLQVCPLFKQMAGVLDPEAKHLSVWPPHSYLSGRGVPFLTAPFGSGMAIGGPDESLFIGIDTSGTWTVDGKGHENAPYSPGPYFSVSMSIYAPGSAGEEEPPPVNHAAHHSASGDMPHGSWGLKTITTLPDGSTVSVRSEHDSGGSTYEAVRTLPSGENLTLYVDAAYGGIDAGVTFSFTQQQLIAAVSIDGVADVTLPVKNDDMKPHPKTSASK